MTPFTCQVTAVFVAFVTVAVNGSVLVVTTEAAVGEMEIVTAGGSCLTETELDAQPCRKKIKIKGRMKKNGTGRSSSERRVILKYILRQS